MAILVLVGGMHSSIRHITQLLEYKVRLTDLALIYSYLDPHGAKRNEQIRKGNRNWWLFVDNLKEYSTGLILIIYCYHNLDKHPRNTLNYMIWKQLDISGFQFGQRCISYFIRPLIWYSHYISLLSYIKCCSW